MLNCILTIFFLHCINLINSKNINKLRSIYRLRKGCHGKEKTIRKTSSYKLHRRSDYRDCRTRPDVFSVTVRYLTDHRNRIKTKKVEWWKQTLLYFFFIIMKKELSGTFRPKIPQNIIKTNVKRYFLLHHPSKPFWAIINKTGNPVANWKINVQLSPDSPGFSSIFKCRNDFPGE